MIKQLAHLCISARDLGETERFYCDTLGLEKGFEFQRGGEVLGFYLKCGSNTFIEVFQGNPGTVGNINHFCLETEDIDAVIAALRAAGYEATDKELGADHSWQSWTTDPNGVRIEFHHYTPDSLQENGGVCHVD